MLTPTFSYFGIVSSCNRLNCVFEQKLCVEDLFFQISAGSSLLHRRSHRHLLLLFAGFSGQISLQRRNQEEHSAADGDRGTGQDEARLVRLGNVVEPTRQRWPQEGRDALEQQQQPERIRQLLQPEQIDEDDRRQADVGPDRETEHRRVRGETVKIEAQHGEGSG